MQNAKWQKGSSQRGTKSSLTAAPRMKETCNKNRTKI